MEIISRLDAKEAGLTRYFTGIVCINGHIAQRRVCSRSCVKCANEASRKHKMENSEQEKARSKQWRENNKQRHAEMISAWRKNNREKCREWCKKYREANPEKVAEMTRQWRSLNKDKTLATNGNRRARSRQAEGNYGASDISVLLELQKHCCAYCGVKVVGRMRHIDHIDPLCLGGSNWPSNLQILCPSCNMKKGGKDPFVWAKENGRLF